MGNKGPVTAARSLRSSAISRENTYITDPGRPRSIFSRIFLSPKFTLYPQVFWIVWSNGRKALRGKYGSAEWAESSLDVLRALENVSVSFEISGMENMKNIEGPAVFIGNHMSTLETLVLPCVIQPVMEVTFVVKNSLLDMPVFGPVMRSRDPVVVGRTNPREDLRTVLEEGSKKLAAGSSLVIFPQSTRSAVFKPEEFNSLGIKLALRAEVPVVPIALKTDAWGIGKLMKEFGPIDTKKKVHIEFGAPMRVAGRGVDEHKKIVEFIRERLERWSKEEKNGYPQ